MSDPTPTTARADHHVAVRVSDIDRSMTFYREALGARPLMVPSLRRGPLIDEVFGAGAAARMCFVALEGGSIELWQFLTPETPIPESDQPRLGVMHFALTVDSVDDAAARVVAAGGRLRFPIKRFGSESSFVYCEDPDGNVFELLDADLDATVARIVASDPSAALPGE